MDFLGKESLNEFMVSKLCQLHYFEEEQLISVNLWTENGSRLVLQSIRERPLMMSDFRGDGGSEMTPKNRTLEGKNWTLGGMGGQSCQKSSDIMNGPFI